MINSTKKEIKKHLKRHKSDQINFDVSHDGYYRMRLKKTKKWGLFYKGETIITQQFDSVSFYSDNLSYIIVKNFTKYGVVMKGRQDNTSCIYDEVRFINANSKVCVLVKSNDKWGQYCPEFNFELIKCNYFNITEVPINYVEKWLAKYMYLVKNKYGTSTHILNNFNENIFIAQSDSTHKWGLFDMDELLIPLEFDSVILFNSSTPLAIVIKDNMVGSFCLLKNNTKLNISCSYNEYKLVMLAGGKFQLALNKDNKWAWVNWKTGELLSSFEANSFYNLPKLN